jgi:hypothetical protein
MDGPHPVAYAEIQLAPDLWSFRLSEVCPPTQHMLPSRSTTCSRLASPERRVSRLTRALNVAFALSATRRLILPPAATQKLYPRDLRSNTLVKGGLGFIHLESQTP